MKPLTQLTAVLFWFMKMPKQPYVLASLCLGIGLAVGVPTANANQSLPEVHSLKSRFGARTQAAPSQVAPAQATPQALAYQGVHVYPEARPDSVAEDEPMMQSTHRHLNPEIEVLKTLESLQQQLSGLQGQLEEQQHSLIQLAKQVHTLQAKQVQLETKQISMVSQTSPLTPAEDAFDEAMAMEGITLSSALTDEPTVPSQPAVEAPVVITESEAYANAYALIESQAFEKARTAFEALLKDYPAGQYRPNAYYWLGEVSLALADPESAITAFKAVIKHHGSHHKAADATYKLGLIQEQKGMTATASQFYKQLIQNYPDATSAKMASARLQKLESLGI